MLQNPILQIVLPIVVVALGIFLLIKNRGK